VFYSDNTFSTFDPSWDYYKLFGNYDNLIDTISEKVHSLF
jgi:hypothetical protein